MHLAKKPRPAPGRATPPPDAGTRSHRRSGTRLRSYGLCAVATAGLVVAALVAVNAGGGNKTGFAAPGGPHANAIRSIPPRMSAPAAIPTHKTAPKADGSFVTAEASGKSVGTGTLRRYKVAAERGTGVSAEGAAREIENVLGDPRSWTADGHDAFQLVSSGPYDFEVKIASPATVDRICGAAGLHTHGEVNCDIGDQVVVNLKRWNTGSPQFPGPIHEYRALIINHEVGHRIGHGHEGCPGRGRPAPAMMQQIDGLHGCVANAWPYDARGRYLAGPPVP